MAPLWHAEHKTSTECYLWVFYRCKGSDAAVLSYRLLSVMDSVHISLLLFLSGGFVLCLAVRSVAGCKISEASPEVQKNCQGYSPLCGNFFLAAYKYACEGRIRKRGNPGTFLSSYTVNPLYNEEPRDWQNLYAIKRFCYIEVLFRIFYYCWDKENRSLYRELRYIEVRYIEVPL